MRRNVIMLMMATICLASNAGELLLGALGKTNYQIVVPDKCQTERIAASIERAAKLIQETFKENAMDITIAKEAQADPSKPGIYLGKTTFALKNGIDFASMKGWTYTFKVIGKNVIVAGNDASDPIPLKNRRPREARHGGIPFLATLKATTEFLYKYCGARFLAPGANGVEFMPTPVIYVPDNLDVTKRPHAKDVEVARDNDIYSIANGFEPSPGIVSNYGHYHHTVISPEVHGKTHPEYFYFAGGKRNTKSSHYCFSNEEVRELIYQKILNDCDTGYDIVEIGQNDGFLPCQCEKCYDLYGIRPTHSPEDGSEYITDTAWGEKIWIMHRDMAMRLKKDRPGKKMMLTAYSVCRNPPTTFDEFPDNVIIQMTHTTIENFKKWSRMRVPGGYSAYLYTWGSFHVTGFTPIRSDQYIKELTDLLIKNNVSLIQNNGKPVSYGIEGMNIYSFHRKMNDPKSKTIRELNEEYIDAAYREGAGAMRSFFRKLNQRMNDMDEAMRRYDRNREPLLVFGSIYTPALLDELESKLQAAEKAVKSPKAKKRLNAVRLEFEFLKHIVNTIYLYYAFQIQKDQISFERVLDAVEARNKWLNSLCGKDSDKGRVSNKQPSFVGRNLSQLMTNGRRMNVEPFNWDTAKMRSPDFLESLLTPKRLVVTNTTKPLTIDSPFWSKLPVYELGKNRGVRDELKEGTTFQIAYDKHNLYIRFDADLKAEDMKFKPRGRDAEIWLQECINICLANSGDKSQYYYLNFEPVANSFTDAQHGFITDVLHPKFGWNDNSWNGDWRYQSVLQKEKNKWLALVTLPFKTFNTPPPKKGDIWYGNFGRVHFYDNMKNRELSVWAGKMNISRTPGDGSFGEMLFE